ncbi:TMEM175 family protein [Bdellovibrio sp. BCCA]|uniref:TMEM175 family protein n=1 Tax=Bdellovibrio sp. BCCA TaxID=3136281 RepID=UPI0030F31178
MTKGRLEAFSDGVLAIIITIMVLELKVPHEGSLEALRPLVPVFCSYVLSFIYVGIYWNNHHNMFHSIQHVNGKVLWANLHLLFWLSLIPVVTAWMGEHPQKNWPVAMYGAVLFFAGIAYYILTRALLSTGKNTEFAKALGTDFKGKISVVIYAIAIALSFWMHWVSYALYIAVACLWFIPDKRFEH